MNKLSTILLIFILTLQKIEIASPIEDIEYQGYDLVDRGSVPLPDRYNLDENKTTRFIFPIENGNNCNQIDWCIEKCNKILHQPLTVNCIGACICRKI